MNKKKLKITSLIFVTTLILLVVTLSGCIGEKTDEEKIVGLWIGWKGGNYCSYHFHKDGTYDLGSTENYGKWKIENGLLLLSIGDFDYWAEYEYWFEDEEDSTLNIRHIGSNVTGYFGRNSYE